tara:strand:- start:729 stop:941 length:213 start_codon:yes stop_codon:yes gene_type:complete
MPIVEGKGTYKVLIGNKVHTCYHWNDIPLSFDNMILFQPDWEEGPHTEEQHKYYESFGDKFDEILKREKN